MIQMPCSPYLCVTRSNIGLSEVLSRFNYSSIYEKKISYLLVQCLLQLPLVISVAFVGADRRLVNAIHLGEALLKIFEKNGWLRVLSGITVSLKRNDSGATPSATPLT